MEEINQVIKRAAEFLDRGAGVIDAQGHVVAATLPDLVSTLDEDAIRVNLGESQVVVSGERSYMKLQLPGQSDYVLFVEGDDTIAHNYLSLLSNWIMAELADGSTEAERLNLLKNILLENELPGDIPLKAREFKIPYAAALWPTSSTSRRATASSAWRSCRACSRAASRTS